MRGVVLCLSLILLLFTALTNPFRIYAAPSWQPDVGTIVTYQVNVTAFDEGGGSSVFSGSVSWSVENITDGVAVVMQGAAREGYDLQNVFEVDITSRRVLTINGENVENMSTYFWIDPDVSIGSLVEIENTTFTVESEDQVLVANVNRTCWLANATFTIENVTGVVRRWYDRETGLQLMVHTNIEIRVTETVWVEVWITPVSTNAFPQTSALQSPGDSEGWKLLLIAALIASLPMGRRGLSPGR